jgi:hypothetical protein
MSSKPDNRWSAVSIACATDACDAAKALKGKRYLSAQAPKLPLADCASPAACKCVYRKFPDRRAGPRREADTTGIKRSAPTPERRGGRGRRSTD